MGSHSVTCHPTEVTFPPWRAIKLSWENTMSTTKADIYNLSQCRRRRTNPESQDHSGMHKKFDKVRPCTFQVMQADKRYFAPLPQEKKITHWTQTYFSATIRFRRENFEKGAASFISGSRTPENAVMYGKCWRAASLVHCMQSSQKTNAKLENCPWWRIEVLPTTFQTETLTLTLTFNPPPVIVMTHTHANGQGQRSFSSKVETNGRTDGRTDRQRQFCYLLHERIW